jgi:hypothetical protein
MTPEAWRAAINESCITITKQACDPLHSDDEGNASFVEVAITASNQQGFGVHSGLPNGILYECPISRASAGQPESWSGSTKLLQGLDLHNVNQRSDVTIPRALAFFGHHANLIT